MLPRKALSRKALFWLAFLGAAPGAAAQSHHAGPRHHATRPDPAVEAARRARDAAEAKRRAAEARHRAAEQLSAQASAQSEAARRQAAAEAARATALSAASVAATERLQATERDADDAAARLAALHDQQEAARRTLEADAAALAPMLPLIERLSLYPAETLLAAPARPDDSLAGLMVLHGLGTELEARARDLRAQQDRLRILSAQLETQGRTLDALQRRQAAQQAAVAARADEAKTRAASSGRAADRAARQAAAAAARAATLDDAVAQLESASKAAQDRLLREAKAADSARQPAAARQARQEAADIDADNKAGPPPPSGGAPVAGRIAIAFGADSPAGRATGITYAPPPAATVTAPCAGRIDFAGPFRSYGTMLILDCGHGYRFVMAGLDRLDVAVGQRLARGAAVGRMPAGSASDGAGRPSLYVQLRHGQATVDPSRFLQQGR